MVNSGVNHLVKLVQCALSHGGAMVIGILRTMCHVITDVTANHRPSSHFTGSPVCGSLNTYTRLFTSSWPGQI